MRTKFIILAMLILSTNKVFCQNVPDNISLSNTLSGTHDILARQSVNLQPGFSYSATSGNTFRASVNPRILNEPDGAKTGNPGGTIGQLVANDGVVGAIPGQFSESPSGAATYTIPIECPAGINGMTPTVSLSYNSQSGNGIAGWGWNIAGLSSVRRSPKTFYYDSESEGIKWDETDNFSLDGMRLFIKNKYPATSSQLNADSIEYKQESGNSVKIFGYDFDINGPQKFKVWTGDGKVMEYCQKQFLDSIYSDVDYYYLQSFPDLYYLLSSGPAVKNKIIGWYLSSIKDIFGNKIIYTYETETITGQQNRNFISYYNLTDTEYRTPIPQDELIVNGSYLKNVSSVDLFTFRNFRLKDITYAGGTYKINFNYETRSDEINEFFLGAQFHLSKRLASIAVNYCVGSPKTIKEYSLTYSTDLYSRLQKVALTGLNNEKYNYTSFSWSNDNYTYDKSNTFRFQDPAHVASRKAIGFVPYKHAYFPGDFNGDGITDFLVTYKYVDSSDYSSTFSYRNWAVFYNTGEISTNLPVMGEGGLENNTKFYIFDNDNDGKDELYFRDFEVPYMKLKCYKHSMNSFTRDTTMDIKLNVSSLIDPNYPNNFDLDNILIIHGDYDGDGKLEFLFLYNNNGTLTYYSSLGFQQGCPSFSFGTPLDYFFTDLNGNGKQEIVFVTTSGFEFWEYSNISATLVKILNAPLPNTTDNIKVGDFNGDGYTDILFHNYINQSWSIATSDGLNFSTNIITPPSTISSGCLIGDFNQDGMSDIMVPTSSSGTMSLNIYISNGIGFDLKLTQQNITNDVLRSFGEADGNFTADCFAGSRDPYFFSISKGIGFNQINKIVSGTGNDINIEYGKSAYHDGYPIISKLESEGNTSIITAPMFSKTVLNIYDGSTSINYRFENPKLHTKGRGFLGFERKSKTVTAGNVSTKSYQHFTIIEKGSADKYELVPDSTINSINNSIISRALTHVSAKNINNEYQLVTDSVSSFDLLNNTRKTQIFSNFDNYLNPLIIKSQSWSNNVKEAETIDSLSYSNNTTNGKWILSQLTQKKTRQKRPGVTDYVRKNDYEYYSSNGALKDEYSEKNTSKELKKSYVYDIFGNITSMTIVSPRDANDSRQRVSGMTYSADGRFPATKTDILGNTESFVYSDETGLLVSNTDINGFTTSYYYDGLGRLKKTIHNDKTEEMTSLFWVGQNNDAPANTTYYVIKQTSGNAPVTVYFDKYGKELRTLSMGLTGSAIYSDKLYDSSDRLWKVSLPYLKTNSPLWRVYSYDNYNRPIGENSPDGRFKTYSYAPREYTVEEGLGTNSQSTTKRTNSIGETIESEDNQGNTVLTKYFASGLPKEVQIAGESYKTRFHYDIYGNRDTIYDPSAGTVISNYNALGYLLSQKDKKNNITSFTYDLAGRVITRTINSAPTTTYTYDTGIKGAVYGVTDGYNSTSYNYDNLSGRLLSQTETIAESSGNKSLTLAYTYDLFGRMETKSWSTGYQITNKYNDYGYQVKITDASRTLWEATSENVLGQITGYTQGAYSTSVSYNSYGDLESMVTSGVRNISYGFDNFKNLQYRQDNLTSQKEVYSYDDLNRLTSITYYLNNIHQSTGDKTINYNNSGNITGKTGVAANGDMKYGENGSSPYALTSISNPGPYAPLNQNISYTPFDKVDIITDTVNAGTVRRLEFKYGFDQQRKKSIYTEGSTNVKKYFFGDYEETDDGTTVKKYFYIGSPTGLCGIYVIEGAGQGKLYHIFTDHLGSLTEIVDASTGTVTKQSFDAWGNIRSTSDWRNPANYALFANRGFTGHEHLEAFALINMNGRVYDPATGRFLSPDLYVQAPDFSQSYNRYSYCLNNPLIYTDPTGMMGRMFPGEKESWFSRRSLDMDGRGGFIDATIAYRALGNRYAGSYLEFLMTYEEKVNSPYNANGYGFYIREIGDYSKTKSTTVIVDGVKNILLSDATVSERFIYVNNPNSQGGIDIDKAIAWLDKNAGADYTKAKGKCATYVISALVEGGAKYRVTTVHAKDFGPTLLDMGLNPVNVSSLNAYTAQRGDVAILQPWRTHTSGHMEMYNGTQWVSDYKQGSFFYPWNGSIGANDLPGFTIYRLP